MGHDTIQRNINKNNKWILLVALTIMIASPLILWEVRQLETVSDKTTVSGSGSMTDSHKTHPGTTVMHDKTASQTSVSGNTFSGESGPTMDEIKAGQTKAAKAAINATPIEGNVSGRPAFVSEIEWDVLNEAIADKGDRSTSLSHLVNKLLFFKKRDAWMNPSTPPDIRKKLAGELLEMIPTQVSIQAIDQTFADKMSADLNVFLSTVTP